MKLFKIYLDNGLEYSDRDTVEILVASKDLEKATERARVELEYYFEKDWYRNTFFEVEEVIQVDGYNVTLSK